MYSSMPFLWNVKFSSTFPFWQQQKFAFDLGNGFSPLGTSIKKFKKYTCYDPAVSFLGIFLAEVLVHVYGNFHKHIECHGKKQQQPNNKKNQNDYHWGKG